MYRFCASPTGEIGKERFCTHVLFYIYADFHRRTANGRPYGSTILEHRIIVGASIARPVLGARPIRIENGNRRFCISPTGDIGNNDILKPKNGKKCLTFEEKTV